MPTTPLQDYKSTNTTPRTAHVLVVDDQSTPRLILQRMMESSGFMVSTAISGMEALQFIEEQEFTLVLLDFLMPGMSGMEVLEKIREHRSPIELPVIMVSMQNESSDIVAAFAKGANDYITKPFDFKILMARINIQIDLKRKEEALQAKERHFRMIIEGAPIGMCLCDALGKAMKINRATCAMLGFSEQELLRNSCLSYTHPDDVEVSSYYREQLLAGKIDHYDLEKRYLHKNGHHIWAHISVIRLTEGIGGNILVIIQDITQRKMATEMLARNKQELEELVQIRTQHLQQANESLIAEIAERKKAEDTISKRELQLLEAQQIAHLGFWERDLATGQVFWSDEIYAILGLDKNEFQPRGEAFVTFIHPDDRDAFIEARYKSQKEGVPFNQQFRIVRPDGDVRKVHDRSKMLPDADGHPYRLVGTIIDITDFSRMSEELSFQESHDLLTRLINRKMFEELLKDTLTLRRLVAEDFEHIVTFICIDQLKVINDTYGHMAGDELICQLSLNLRQRLRKQDSLARLAGNRFGILMENCTLQEAHRVLESIRTAMNDFNFTWVGKRFSITVSMGVVPIRDYECDIIETLAKADLACGAAKEDGGNRIHIHTEGDDTVGLRHEEMLWVERIDKAVRENRLQLYYQPIVGIRENPLEQHCEILIRMLEDDGALIPPGTFLPAAERYRLTSRIDRWVISNTLAWLELNQVNFTNEICWGINLSGQSLADENLLNFVIQELEQSGINPRSLYFEITETAAIANLKNAIRFITTLREHGVRFALDDFGSGLSSFAYLKNLPVDFLKIDGIFVKEIVHNDTDYAMVKAINDVGKAMGKQTIAEFVEDLSIVEKLREIGVDFAQGYGICKPLPLKEYFQRSL